MWFVSVSIRQVCMETGFWTAWQAIKGVKNGKSIIQSVNPIEKIMMQIFYTFYIPYDRIYSVCCMIVVYAIEMIHKNDLDRINLQRSFISLYEYKLITIIKIVFLSEDKSRKKRIASSLIFCCYCRSDMCQTQTGTII